MKKIYFIRHAKAKDEGQNDFERELNKRGLENAKFMGERLKKHSVLPDAIYSSTAKRAKKTAKIIADEIKFSKKINFCDNLYEASLNSMIYFINSLSDELNSVFIVGHNPTITEICEILSDSAIGNIPTCGIFCIEFDALNFKDINAHEGRALFFDYPKKIHLT